MIRSSKVVEIAPHLRRFIDGDYRWQVCFDAKQLAKRNKLIDPDLHDWLLVNARGTVKVQQDAVWFSNEDDALLCHMRFSGGS